MATIQDYLDQISSAVYGKDVRSAIYNAIHQCYEDGKAGSVDLTARESIEKLAAEIQEILESGTTAEAVQEKVETVIEELINNGTMATLETVTDDTLSLSGVPADAAAVGEELAEMKVSDGITQTSETIFSTDDHDGDWYVDGEYWDSSMAAATSSSYRRSVYIPVKEKAWYKLRESESGYYQYFAFFDEDYNVVSDRLFLSPYQTHYQAPEGAAYFCRWNSKSNLTDSLSWSVIEQVDTDEQKINAEQITEIPLNKVLKEVNMNLLSGYELVSGSRYAITGNDWSTYTVTSSDYYVIEDYIPVEPGETYSCYFGLTNTLSYLLYYNADKELISSIKSGGVTSFTVPDGVYYIRVSGMYKSLNVDDVYLRKSEFDSYVDVTDEIHFYVLDTDNLVIIPYAKIDGLDGLEDLVQSYVQDFQDTIQAKTFSGSYQSTLPSEDLATTYAGMFDDLAESEAFLLFTDPHTWRLADGDDAEDYEAKTIRHFTAIEQMYNRTPAETVICLGDWQKGSDNGNGTAAWLKYGLGWIDKMFRQKFGDNYISLVGNHDINEQNSNPFTVQTVHNLFCRRGINGGCYFQYEGTNTTFYCLDTRANESESDTVTDYDCEQLDWLADCLKSDDKTHSIITMHMYNLQSVSSYESSGSVPVQSQMGAELSKLLNAYNSRSTVTVNSVSYDFSACSGTVHCILCGHVHFDFDTEDDYGLPIIGTTWMRGQGRTEYDDESIFDLVCVDYDNGLYKTVRVGGTLANRKISLYMH